MNGCVLCGFKGEFTREKFGQYIICYCPVCYARVYETCKHEKNNPVKYSQDEKVYVKNLCVECKFLNGSFIKQSTVNLVKLKTINKEKHDKYHQDCGERYAARIKEIDILRNQQSKKVFFEKYNEYLKTTEWQERRDEVLKRDNYICQACLNARATQVHHLNYVHWGNEPLFDLVAICNECHEKITKMDRDK
jgi:5-methylcytosine-specific restriction endonuclease McrA